MRLAKAERIVRDSGSFVIDSFLEKYKTYG